MKSLIDRKPTFPIGSTFLDSWTIYRPIFCVESYEIYEIQSNSKNIWGLMIRCKTNDEAMEQNKKHLTWWQLQTEDRIKVLASEIRQHSGCYWVLACLEIAKKMILFEERGNLLGQDQAELLMTDLITLYRLAQTNNITPIMDIGSMLLIEQNGVINGISFFVRLSSPSAELENVTLIAKNVFYFATGIDYDQYNAASYNKRSFMPVASRWNKYIDKRFSSLLERCLNKHDPNRITSLSNLELQLRAILESCIISQTDIINKNQENISKENLIYSDGLAKVAGMTKLKTLLMEEVISPIRNPEPFKRYGLSIPNGILLYGPPGCGKTFIARQLAEEVGWYFKEIKGSDIGSVYIHGSVLAIRDLFDELEEHAPAMVFIDEFEGLVPKRSELSGIQQYKSEEVNEFLVHLNECSNKKIFIIAATNEPNKIDEAILRPGRLDKMILVEPPDFEARIELLKMYLSNRPLANFQFEKYAELLEGYSCVDIRHIADEAARLAKKEGELINEKHLTEAIRRNPPSLSCDILTKYTDFHQRGI